MRTLEQIAQELKDEDKEHLKRIIQLTKEYEEVNGSPVETPEEYKLHVLIS